MKFTTTAAAAGIAIMMAGGASAATFTTDTSITDAGTGNGGNYCGDFINGTDGCNVDGSPWIVKYDFNEGDSSWNITEFNTLFGNSADFGGITINDLGSGDWSFTYTPDSDDPGITAFSAKGGSSNGNSGGGNFLYKLTGSDAFFGGQDIEFEFPQGNSNITFFDSDGDTTVVPLPAAGWLMLAGLGGLAVVRRRKKSA